MANESSFYLKLKYRHLLRASVFFKKSASLSDWLLEGEGLGGSRPGNANLHWSLPVYEKERIKNDTRCFQCRWRYLRLIEHSFFVRAAIQRQYRRFFHLA